MIDTISTEKRIQVIKEFTGESGDWSETPYDSRLFESGTIQYLVLTDDEADERTHDYISSSLWAFNPSFLAELTDLPEAVFSFASELCEDANEPMRQIIDGSCGIEDLVDAAISADGRGTFISGYDNVENELGDFFIYRIN